MPDKNGLAATPAQEWTSLKAWANAIGIIGIPGTIAIFTVYVITTEIPRVARSTEVAITELRQTRDAVRENTILLNKVIRITQRTCFNAAKDENGRQACFD